MENKNAEPFTQSVIDRFWSKVDQLSAEECWLWKGAKNQAGYGLFGIGPKCYRAHRISCSIASQRQLYPEEVVRHSCDTPACVNPSHLTAGTHADNMRDVAERKRHYFAKQTHCKRGHPYEGCYIRKTGFRLCRECANITHQQRRSKQKGMNNE